MQYNRETVGDSTICCHVKTPNGITMHGKKKKFHLSTTISARLRPSFLTMTAALSVIFTISPVKLSTQSILIMPGSSAGRTAVLIIPSRGGFFFFFLFFTFSAFSKVMVTIFSFHSHSGLFLSVVGEM